MGGFGTWPGAAHQKNALVYKGLSGSKFRTHYFRAIFREFRSAVAIFAQPLQESLPPRVNPAALLLRYASSSSSTSFSCHASSSNTSGAARQKMPLRRMEGDFLGEPLPR